MSLEELEEDGILLPRDKWGTHELHISVPRIPLIVLAIGSIVACAMMYVGDGDFWTWISLVAFLAILGLFTWVSFRGIR